MSELRTPDFLSTDAQNELICEKLLGWRKCSSFGAQCAGWTRPDSAAHSDNAPGFTTWAEAGLILEALGARSIRWHLTRSVQFGVFIFSLDPIGNPWGEWQEKRDRNGPLAIRAAALAYIRSTP
jgi:hypothetical protein